MTLAATGRVFHTLILLCSICEFVSADEAWKNAAIPAAWKEPASAKVGQGFNWFRCAVTVPEAWQGKDLELFLEPVDDAREAYFNGLRVGGAGSFPPEFRSGLGSASRHRIAAAHVRFGQPNLLAVRTYNLEGRTGFNVAAPVLFGGEGAIRCEGTWQVRAGDDVASAKWDGQLEPLGPAVFTKVESAADIERTLKKLAGEEGPLSVAEALRRMRVPADLQVEVSISEPEIGQPLSFKFDERGRLWVVQYLQYPTPAGLKAISRDKHLRTVYDKVPPAPPNHFKGADKITIHEDTDGDGRFDKHQTFVDGLSLMSSFAIGRGGVFVLNPPYLLFYPDRNHDDVPDGDPEVLLEGFGIEDSHSIANSLRWGPDGWLYAAQGSTVTGHVKRRGEPDKLAVHSMGQLIWRYHPETRRYEIFAEGGGNAFGVEIDAKGRIFSGHNGGDTRGFHYVQGGYLQKGFGKHGALSNPHAYGYFNMMAHASVPRFTHTFIIYEEEGLSGQYAGKLFGVAPLQGHVVYSELLPDRSSFKTRDLGHPLSTSDTWFRPVDIQTGPDGSIYVADLYEQRIDHAAHYQGRIDKTTGRIYRLKAKDAPIPPLFDYGRLTSEALAKLLAHPGKWHRQTVLRLLADRRDASVVPLLEKTLANSSGQLALESLWAIYLSGGLTEEAALRSLDHADPYVRLWTARLLCDEKQVSPALAQRLAALAQSETHVDARSQLACSARRLPAADCLAIVKNLLTHDEDAGDIHLPLLLWWAIESKCESDRDAVAGLFADAALWDRPLVRDHLLEKVMRRYASTGARKDLLTCARLLQLAPTAEHSKRLLAGFEKAYEGRSLNNLPTELLAAITKAGGGSLALRLRQGDAEAIARTLELVANEKTPRGERLQYTQIFGQIGERRCVSVLLGVLEQAKDNDLRRAALAALQAYNDERVSRAALTLYKSLPDDVRGVAQTLLASRPTWARELLAAVDAGQIETASISESVVRKLLMHSDPQIGVLVKKHFGELQGATTSEMHAQVENLKSVLATAAGNPYKGKTLFASQCGKCHVLFGQGGNIGPDLTSFKRDDLNRVLLNVVNPSAEIREGYENYVVSLQDGRTLNGFLEDQDSQVIVLKGIDGQSTVISREEIEELKAIPRSIMPDGILKPFPDQDVRDLFAYLRATQPLP